MTKNRAVVLFLFALTLTITSCNRGTIATSLPKVSTIGSPTSKVKHYLPTSAVRG